MCFFCVFGVVVQVVLVHVVDPRAEGIERVEDLEVGHDAGAAPLGPPARMRIVDLNRGHGRYHPLRSAATSGNAR